MLDQERCVLCWRCIRYMEEWEDKPQLGSAQARRPHHHRRLPGPAARRQDLGQHHRHLPGGRADRPHGALRLSALGAHEDAQHLHALPGRLQPAPGRARRTSCAASWHARTSAVNDEWICDKGRFVRDYVDHPDRLKTPLVRENGALRPASWDEALQRVVERLSAVVEAHGAKVGRRRRGGAREQRGGFPVPEVLPRPDRQQQCRFPHRLRRAGAAGRPAGDRRRGAERPDRAGGRGSGEAAPVLDLLTQAGRQAPQAPNCSIINPRRIEAARYPGAYLPVRPGSEAIALNGLAAWLLAKRAAEAAVSKAGHRPRRQRPAASGPGPRTNGPGVQRLTRPSECRSRSRCARRDAMAAAVRTADRGRAAAVPVRSGSGNRRARRGDCGGADRPGRAAGPRPTCWPTSRPKPTARVRATWACCPMLCPAIGRSPMPACVSASASSGACSRRPSRAYPTNR